MNSSVDFSVQNQLTGIKLTQNAYRKGKRI